MVTFHSVEDRIVKRFFQHGTGGAGNANRYAPLSEGPEATWEPVTKKAVGPDEAELSENPRSRSARLRVARRTAAPPRANDPRALGAPVLPGKRR